MVTETKAKPSKIERREVVKQLDCKLTEDEILKYGRALAKIGRAHV